MTIHPIQTGLVKIRPHQMAARRSGVGAMADILLDDKWSDWLPIYAWAIEHDEGVILVDTGETARVQARGEVLRAPRGRIGRSAAGARHRHA